MGSFLSCPVALSCVIGPYCFPRRRTRIGRAYMCLTDVIAITLRHHPGGKLLTLLIEGPIHEVHFTKRAWQDRAKLPHGTNAPDLFVLLVIALVVHMRQDAGMTIHPRKDTHQIDLEDATRLARPLHLIPLTVLHPSWRWVE